MHRGGGCAGGGILCGTEPGCTDMVREFDAGDWQFTNPNRWLLWLILILHSYHCEWCMILHEAAVKGQAMKIYREESIEARVWVQNECAYQHRHVKITKSPTPYAKPLSLAISIPVYFPFTPSVIFIAMPHRHFPASVPVAWNSKCLVCGLRKFLLRDHEWDEAWCHFCRDLRESYSHPSLYTSNILWWDRIRRRDSYNLATVVYRVYISPAEDHRSRQSEGRRSYQSTCLSWESMEFESYSSRLRWWLLCAERWWVVDAITLGTT